MSAADNNAVFLSYASQDAEVAKKICEALRAVGVEVWFDQNELVGGDAWDQKIRRQIKECALFVPIISANTQSRTEGYFRLEWRLADQRTHLMAKGRAFLLPIVIDGTRDADAHVPDSFTEVQWTRLPGGEAPEKFCARVQRLLEGEVAPVSDRRSETGTPTSAGQRPALPREKPSRAWSVPAIIGAALLVAVAVYFALRPRRSPEEIAKLLTSVQTAAASVAAKSPPAVPSSAAGAAFPRDPDLKRAWDLFLNTPNNTMEDFALAEDLVKAVAVRRPADPELVIVYAWLNDTFINRGFDVSEERYVLGRRYTERAMQLAPEDPEALAALGQFLSFRGADPQRAEQLLRRAIELNPHEARFYRALSYNVLRISHPAEALQLQERAAELFPADPLVFYELGLHYRDAGRLDDMERAFDRCLTLAPIGGAMLWKAWIAAWVHGDVAGMRHWLDQLPAAVRLNDRALIVRYESACLSRNPAEVADAVRIKQCSSVASARGWPPWASPAQSSIRPSRSIIPATW